MSELKQNSSQQVQNIQKIVIENKVEEQNAQIVNQHQVKQQQQQKDIVSEQMNHQLINQEPKFEDMKIKQTSENVIGHKSEPEIIQIDYNKEAKDAIQDVQQPPQTKNQTQIIQLYLNREQKHENNELQKENKVKQNILEQKEDSIQNNIQKKEEQKNISDKVQRKNIDLIELDTNQALITVDQSDKNIIHTKTLIVEVKLETQQEVKAQQTDILKHTEEANQQESLFSNKQKHQDAKTQLVAHLQQNNNEQLTNIIPKKQQLNHQSQEQSLKKVNQEQPITNQKEKQSVCLYNPPVDAIASQQLYQTIYLQDKIQLDLEVQNPKEQVINQQQSNQLNQIKQFFNTKFDQANKIQDQDNNWINQDQKTKPENAQAMLEQYHPHINEEQKNIEDIVIKQEYTEDLIKIEHKQMNQQLPSLSSEFENKSKPVQAPQLKAQNNIDQSQQNISGKVDLQQKNIVQVNMPAGKNEKQQSQNIQQVNKKSESQQRILINPLIANYIDKQQIVPSNLEEQITNQNQKQEANENNLNNFTQQKRVDQISKQNESEIISPEANIIEQKAIIYQQKQEKYQVGNQLQKQSDQLKIIQNPPNQSLQAKEQLKNDPQKPIIIDANNDVVQEDHQQENIEQKPVQRNQNNQFENRQKIQINILKIQSDQQCSNKEEHIFSQEKIQYVPDPELQKQQKSKEAEVFMDTQNKQENQIQQLLKSKEDKIIAQRQNIAIQKVRNSAQQRIQQQIEEKYKAQLNQQPKNSQNNLNNYTFDQNHHSIHAENINYSNKQQNLQTQMFHPYKQEIIEGKQDVNKKVIEFIEFNQQDQIKLQNLQVNNKKEVLSQASLRLQSQKKKDTQIIIVQTPSKNIIIQKQSDSKTIEITQEQISQKKTPIIQQNIPNKEGVGRIARKIVSEKRVQDVIQDLKKYQQKDPKKQSRPSSRRRKLDIAKADHISIKSNIISVTIGQILSKEDDHMEADKLLNEIDQLKKKLFELEKRREIAQRNEEQRDERPEKQTLPSNISNKKLQTGKIYRRSDSNNSRVTEEVQTFGYATENNNFVTISSAPRQRFSSTQDFSVPKSATKQVQFQNKTGPILFRVKKNNNKAAHGPFDFNLNEKEIGIIKYKEFDSEDKCFQAKRQDTEKLQINSQETLNILQKPSPRALHFEENFRQQIEKYFINLGNELPKRDWSQEQLVEIARQTFKKFGINIHSQKNLTLSVKKYKNCVSFVLDCNRTILWYYEGKFYFGGWKTNRSGEGEKNGWGYDYSPGKYVFSGYYIQNKRNGYGVIKLLTRQQDVIYQGGWENGLKHGLGKQKEPDGSQYIGEWAQGKKNGKGKIKGIDQEYFEGSFLNGVKNGQGIERFKNGDSYEGNYYDGKFHGIGVYTWANQSKYEGQFKEGSRNGNGTWVSNYNDENSDRNEGQYRNDRKNGYGIYRWKDGTVYEGQFLNDLKHGQGIVTYGDGKSTKLQWFEGNVVPKQNAEKQRIGGKRSISKSSSKKGEQKNIQTKTPLIKFNIGNESKLKPTRKSLGIQQI